MFRQLITLDFSQLSYYDYVTDFDLKHVIEARFLYKYKLGIKKRLNHSVSLGTDPPLQTTAQQFSLSPQELKNLTSPQADKKPQ